MKIKKAYEEIIDFLELNLDLTVGHVIEQVKAMAESKKGVGGGSRGSASVIRNSAGEVVAMFCYYHKMWEIVVGENAVEYGIKVSSSSGLNSMCKEGSSRWTKQNNEAKKSTAGLLASVSDGSILVSEIPDAQVDIEEIRSSVVPRQDTRGHVSRSYVIERLVNDGHITEETATDIDEVEEKDSMDEMDTNS